MLKFLALTLLGVVAVHAQVPHHCIVPPELSFHANEFNHHFTTFRRFDVEYDARSERVAYLEREREGTGVQLEWIILLHQENVGYEINIKTKQCKKVQPGRFFPFAVPRDAKLDDEVYIGGPGEDVEVNVWYLGGKSSNFDWAGSFSRINCYPVRTFLKSNHNNHTVTTNFYNLAQGIIDPTRFIPPPECFQATEFEQPSDTLLNLQQWFRP